MLNTLFLHGKSWGLAWTALIYHLSLDNFKWTRRPHNLQHDSQCPHFRSTSRHKRRRKAIWADQRSVSYMTNSETSAWLILLRFQHRNYRYEYQKCRRTYCEKVDSWLCRECSPCHEFLDRSKPRCRCPLGRLRICRLNSVVQMSADVLCYILEAID